MIHHSKILGFYTTIILSLLIISCANQVKTDHTIYNYQVDTSNTLTGKKLQGLLAPLSDSKGDMIHITISDETVHRRAFGLDEKGQPNRFLHELMVQMTVSKNGKVVASESLSSLN